MNQEAYLEFKKREGYKNPNSQVERILKLANILKAEKLTREQLARRCSVHIKTIRRDLRVLEKFYDLDYDGFNRPFIFAERGEEGLLLTLTNEEMQLLSDLIKTSNHSLKEGLIEKLDRKSKLEIDSRAQIAKKVNTIQLAIGRKKRVLLKDYQGLKDKEPKTIEVEPIRVSDFRYLIAFDPDHESKSNKTYSLDRINAGVTISQKEWSFEREHDKNTESDIFGLMIGKPIEVELALTSTAYGITKSRYPKALEEIIKVDEEEFPYILKTKTYNLTAVGNLILSMPGHFKLIKGEGLREHLYREIEKFSF